LQEIRTWYNHDRPHDHLHGRTPAEVWAALESGTELMITHATGHMFVTGLRMGPSLL